MATQLEKFDSTGGFSIAKTVIVDELRNAKDINSLEIKNSEYTDSCLLYTSPSPRDATLSRMPSSA